MSRHNAWYATYPASRPRGPSLSPPVACPAGGFVPPTQPVGTRAARVSHPRPGPPASSRQPAGSGRPVPNKNKEIGSKSSTTRTTTQARNVSLPWLIPPRGVRQPGATPPTWPARHLRPPAPPPPGPRAEQCPNEWVTTPSSGSPMAEAIAAQVTPLPPPSVRPFGPRIARCPLPLPSPASSPSEHRTAADSPLTDWS